MIDFIASKIKKTLFMKSITEYSRNSQQVFEFDFRFSLIPDDDPAEDHITFINLLQRIPVGSIILEKTKDQDAPQNQGRLIFKSVLMKSFFPYSNDQRSNSSS